MRFKSTFKGTPPFTVKWFKDDTELITGPSCFIGLEGLSCFLDLYSVGVLQSGVYSCQVSNDAGTERCSANLTVKGWNMLLFKLLHWLPSFLDWLPSFRLSSNAFICAQLFCIFTAPPPPPFHSSFSSSQHLHQHLHHINNCLSTMYHASHFPCQIHLGFNR